MAYETSHDRLPPSSLIFLSKKSGLAKMRVVELSSPERCHEARELQQISKLSKNEEAQCKSSSANFSCSGEQVQGPLHLRICHAASETTIRECSVSATSLHSNSTPNPRQSQFDQMSLPLQPHLLRRSQRNKRQKNISGKSFGNKLTARFILFFLVGFSSIFLSRAQSLGEERLSNDREFAVERTLVTARCTPFELMLSPIDIQSGGGTKSDAVASIRNSLSSIVEYIEGVASWSLSRAYGGRFIKYKKNSFQLELDNDFDYNGGASKSGGGSVQLFLGDETAFSIIQVTSCFAQFFVSEYFRDRRILFRSGDGNDFKGEKNRGTLATNRDKLALDFFEKTPNSRLSSPSWSSLKSSDNSPHLMNREALIKIEPSRDQMTNFVMQVINRKNGNLVPEQMLPDSFMANPYLASVNSISAAVSFPESSLAASWTESTSAPWSSNTGKTYSTTDVVPNADDNWSTTEEVAFTTSSVPSTSTFVPSTTTVILSTSAPSTTTLAPPSTTFVPSTTPAPPITTSTTQTTTDAPTTTVLAPTSTIVAASTVADAVSKTTDAPPITTDTASSNTEDEPSTEKPLVATASSTVSNNTDTLAATNAPTVAMGAVSRLPVPSTQATVAPPTTSARQTTTLAVAAATTGTKVDTEESTTTEVPSTTTWYYYSTAFSTSTTVNPIDMGISDGLFKAPSEAEIPGANEASKAVSDTEADNTNQSLSIPFIVGIAFGGIFLVAASSVFVWERKRKRTQQKALEETVATLPPFSPFDSSRSLGDDTAADSTAPTSPSPAIARRLFSHHKKNRVDEVNVQSPSKTYKKRKIRTKKQPHDIFSSTSQPKSSTSSETSKTFSISKLSDLSLGNIKQIVAAPPKSHDADPTTPVLSPANSTRSLGEGLSKNGQVKSSVPKSDFTDDDVLGAAEAGQVVSTYGNGYDYGDGSVSENDFVQPSSSSSSTPLFKQMGGDEQQGLRVRGDGLPRQALNLLGPVPDFQQSRGETNILSDEVDVISPRAEGNAQDGPIAYARLGDNGSDDDFVVRGKKKEIEQTKGRKKGVPLLPPTSPFSAQENLVGPVNAKRLSGKGGLPSGKVLRSLSPITRTFSGLSKAGSSTGGGEAFELDENWDPDDDEHSGTVENDVPFVRSNGPSSSSNEAPVRPSSDSSAKSSNGGGSLKRFFSSASPLRKSSAPVGVGEKGREDDGVGNAPLMKPGVALQFDPDAFVSYQMDLIDDEPRPSSDSVVL